MGEIDREIDYPDNVDYIIHTASPTDSRYFVKSPVETILKKTREMILKEEGGVFADIARQSPSGRMDDLALNDIAKKMQARINKMTESYPDTVTLSSENFFAFFHFILNGMEKGFVIFIKAFLNVL